MDGVIVVVLDPRALALLAIAGVLPMISYPIAIPIEVWRPLTQGRSDSVAFAVHSWFEAHRADIRLLDPATGAGRLPLGENAVMAVLTEDHQVRRAINQEGRQAVIAVSSNDLLQALEAGHLIHSAEALAATAREELAEWRRFNTEDLPDQAWLKQRLLENLDAGVLSFV